MRTGKPTGHKERWQRITEAMEAAGIETQTELARVVGVTPSALTKWKFGDALPSMESMVRLAKASGFCIEYLMLGRGRRHYNAEDRVAQLIEILDSLDPAEQKDVVAYARFRSRKDSDHSGE